MVQFAEGRALDDLRIRITLLEQFLEKERDTVARENEIAADLKDRYRWRQRATDLLADQCTGNESFSPTRRHVWWPL